MEIFLYPHGSLAPFPELCLAGQVSSFTGLSFLHDLGYLLPILEANMNSPVCKVHAHREVPSGGF